MIARKSAITKKNTYLLSSGVVHKKSSNSNGNSNIRVPYNKLVYWIAILFFLWADKKRKAGRCRGRNTMEKWWSDCESHSTDGMQAKLEVVCV
jgi:hypothetical protein